MKPVYVCILVAVLATCDYFLFREYELVWPFFWMPYAVLFLIFMVNNIKNKSLNKLSFAVYAFVIIPVFSGLTMSLAWMAKINFWGEQAAFLFK
ncbi:MAG: hypothetical protein IJ075_06115 [Lachnospiraceae bacterium]|nr:hypothetical protein [Lachnospiraceae bacterium]